MDNDTHRSVPVAPLLHEIRVRYDGSLLELVRTRHPGADDNHVEYKRLDALLSRGERVERMAADNFCVEYLGQHPSAFYGDWCTLPSWQDRYVQEAERSEARAAVLEGWADEEIDAYFGSSVTKHIGVLREKGVRHRMKAAWTIPPVPEHAAAWLAGRRGESEVAA